MDAESLRFERRVKRRKVSQAVGAEFVSTVVGKLKRGTSVFALTMGRFSLVDVIDNILQQMGEPAELAWFTWTIGAVEARLLGELADRHQVQRSRFVLDYSFKAREPGVWESMRDRFGVDSVRVTKVHAKLTLIRSKRWNIVVRSSMNLNECPRLEFVEIDDDAAMSNFLWSVVDAYWSHQTSDEAADLFPAEHVRRFGLELLGFKTPEDVVDERFYRDGVGVVDLRRVGRTPRS